MGFLIVDIATVAQGVVLAQGGGYGAGDGQDIAPGIVCVLHDLATAGVQDRRYIALQVGHIEILCAIEGQGHGFARGIIGKVHDHGADIQLIGNGQLAQTTSVVYVVVGNHTVGPAGPHAVGIVGVGPGRTSQDDLTRLGIDHIARAVGELTAVHITGIAGGHVDKHGGRIAAAGTGTVPGIAAVGAGLPLVAEALAPGFYAEGHHIAISIVSWLLCAPPVPSNRRRGPPKQTALLYEVLERYITSLRCVYIIGCLLEL